MQCHEELYMAFYHNITEEIASKNRPIAKSE